MDLNFAEFLEEYVPIMPESIKDGILNRLTYSENLTKISFYITFPHLVPAQDLVALEHELEIRLEIHAVRLHPRARAVPKEQEQVEHRPVRLPQHAKGRICRGDAAQDHASAFSGARVAFSTARVAFSPLRSHALA